VKIGRKRMATSVTIRLMKIEDYENALGFWKAIPGVGLRPLEDSSEGINRFLKRNPNTCFVSVYDGEIVGTILVGNDGRCGYLYHVAVKPSIRGKGSVQEW
jgi:ribosomal protein S18 acetylase RimI-like enzyme